MSYVTQARAALLQALGETEADWDSAGERLLLDLYTLLVLQRGSECSCADIHDAWAVARQRTRPDHPDLVAFGIWLDVQGFDVRFRDAVRVAGSALVS